MDNEKLASAYKQQIEYSKAVWNDHTYGIERVFRLFLCLIQFIYPMLLIRNTFGTLGSISRKISVECYILIKLLIPILVLFSGWHNNHFIIVLVIYLLSETIFHILNIIFLSDIYGVSVSYRRSVLLLLLNYIEVVLDFSIIYAGLNLLNKALSPAEAIYFSFVTQTTLGFGDYYPKGHIGQVVVVFQLIIFIMFVLLFINYFSSRANQENEK